MVNRSFLVASLGSRKGRNVVIEADVLHEGRAQIKIIDIEDSENLIFDEVLDESTIEGIQNFFIMIRNEMGRERLSALTDIVMTN